MSTTFAARMEACGSGAVRVVALASLFEQPDSDRPLALFLHGALRSAEQLLHWAVLLGDRFDTILIDLPGHGRSTVTGEVSVRGFAADLRSLLLRLFPRRRMVIVGESLGGLVSLALGQLGGPDIRAVVAADPPLANGKLWHVADAMRGVLAENGGRDPAFVQALAYNVFGVRQGQDVVEERLYYDLFDGWAGRPRLVLTGDLPLGMPRQAAGVPCFIDEVDRFIIGRLYPDVPIRQVTGSGHLVLVQGRTQSLGEILSFVLPHCNESSGTDPGRG